MHLLVWLFFTPVLSFGHISESVTCTASSQPDGIIEKYILLRLESTSAFVSLHRNQKLEVESALLARDLECKPAKSDFRVVNCIRRAPAGGTRVSDASLTIVKHSYLSAGQVLDQKNENRDVLTESYRLYFRDDKTNKKPLEKIFFLTQCRATESGELEWAKALLTKSP